MQRVAIDLMPSGSRGTGVLCYYDGATLGRFADIDEAVAAVAAALWRQYTDTPDSRGAVGRLGYSGAIKVASRPGE